MIFTIKLILTICLLITFIQDIKSRGVWWFIFPILIGSMGLLHFYTIQSPYNFYLNTFLNLCILSLLMLVSYSYFKIRRKDISFSELIGLGDLLFFLAIAIGFPIISFTVILTSCLILSLVIHLILKTESSPTVPLAGYASIGLLSFYVADWVGSTNTLYTI